MLTSRRQALLALLLWLSVIALYLPTLRGGFVYDSIAQVLYSDYIHTPSHWGDVLTLRVVGQDELDRNRPLHLASLMLDAAIWGKNPFGYRLTSVSLHAVNAALLFVFVAIALRLKTSVAGAEAWRDGPKANGGATANVTAVARPPLCGSSPPAVVIPAAFGALVFALHPLVVEVIAEPSNREDLLVLLPMLVGLLFIIAPICSGFAVNAALAACSFFAVLAKESGVAVPFVFAVAAWLFGKFRCNLPGLITAFIAVTAFLCASYFLRPEASAILSRSPAPLAQDFPTILATQIRIWTLQIWQIVWPWNLSAHYPPQALSGIATAGAVVLFSAIVAGLFFLCRRRPLAALGAAIYLLTLLPASNFVPQYHPIADRYLYVPLAGVAIIVAALVAWSSDVINGRVALFLVCLLVLCAEYAANVRRQIIWQHPANVWSDVLRQYPGTTQALLGVANAAWRAGDFAAARGYASEAVSQSGGHWAEVLAMLAMCEWKLGDREAARRNFEQARSLSRVYSDERSMAAALIWSPEQLGVLSEMADH